MLCVFIDITIKYGVSQCLGIIVWLHGSCTLIGVVVGGRIIQCLHIFSTVFQIILPTILHHVL